MKKLGILLGLLTYSGWVWAQEEALDPFAELFEDGGSTEGSADSADAEGEIDVLGSELEAMPEDPPGSQGSGEAVATAPVPYEEPETLEDIPGPADTAGVQDPIPEEPPLAVAPEDPTVLGPVTNEDDFSQEDPSLLGTGLLNPDDGFLPDDVRQLEQRLDQAQGAPGVTETLRHEGMGEPGEGLRPSEQFARIPLRPPMSDANWNRWAGPLVQKTYQIRRGDTLWSISQRLFGTPYLWPKIWHLNARFTNPHIIEKGLELSFSPGNPNSAPELAFKDQNADSQKVDIYPRLNLDRKLTLLELVDETLRRQIAEQHPPFQHFLLDTPPKELSRIPAMQGAARADGRFFYRTGDGFRLKMKDGLYPVARMISYTDKLFRAYRVRWVATLQVKDNFAVVEKAFTEIGEGDLILDRDFRLSPLAIHRDVVGPDLRDQISFVPLQEGGELSPGAHQLIGVRFPNTEAGPRPGAILEIKQGYKRSSLALLVDRDRQVGTMWIIRGDREVSKEDEFQ